MVVMVVVKERPDRLGESRSPYNAAAHCARDSIRGIGRLRHVRDDATRGGAGANCTSEQERRYPGKTMRATSFIEIAPPSAASRFIIAVRAYVPTREIARFVIRDRFD